MVLDGVKEVKEGTPSEKTCKVYGYRQEGKGPRSLCEIHEKTTAESSCEIPGCKLKARAFVNVNEPRRNAVRRERGHTQVEGLPTLHDCDFFPNLTRATGRSTGTGGAHGESRTKRRKKQEDGGLVERRTQEGAA